MLDAECGMHAVMHDMYLKHSETLRHMLKHSVHDHGATQDIHWHSASIMQTFRSIVLHVSAVCRSLPCSLARWSRAPGAPSSPHRSSGLVAACGGHTSVASPQMPRPPVVTLTSNTRKHQQQREKHQQHGGESGSGGEQK